MMQNCENSKPAKLNLFIFLLLFPYFQCLISSCSKLKQSQKLMKILKRKSELILKLVLLELDIIIFIIFIFFNLYLAIRYLFINSMSLRYKSLKMITMVF